MNKETWSHMCRVAWCGDSSDMDGELCLDVCPAQRSAGWGQCFRSWGDELYGDCPAFHWLGC
jgi:hypothetical protein